MKRTCPVCGDFFTVRNGRKYCSALCSKKPAGMKAVRKARIKELTLEEVGLRAKAEGISYGEYMAKYYWS